MLMDALRFPEPGQRSREFQSLLFNPSLLFCWFFFFLTEVCACISVCCSIEERALLTLHDREAVGGWKTTAVPLLLMSDPAGGIQACPFGPGTCSLLLGMRD